MRSPSTFHLQMSQRRQLAVYTMMIMCVLQLLLMISQVEGIASPVRFQSVVDACSVTRYPQECMSSLFSSQQADNQNFLGSVVTSAQGGVQDLYSFSSSLQVDPGSPREQDALNTCLQTLQASKRQIDTTLAELAGGFTPQNFQSKMHDILTWLSASLTYHTTCTVDGWESVGGSAQDAIRARGVYSEKLLVNAVAFAANVLGSFQDTSKSSNVVLHHRRRLKSADEFSSGSGSSSNVNIDEEKVLFEMDGEGYPHWLRGGVRRRLLQQNNHLTIYDAVVSQDGRGQFRTIQAAVDAAPQFNPKIHVIKINQGIYYERVTVPWNSSNIMFIGDGMYKTVISASRSVARDKTTTYWTATVGKQSTHHNLYNSLYY
jgi:pectinesterase